MNINTYVSVNTSLVVIGLYSNITLVISLYSICHAINIIKNSFKCGICKHSEKHINKQIVLIVVLSLLLDVSDVVRFIF